MPFNLAALAQQLHPTLSKQHLLHESNKHMFPVQSTDAKSWGVLRLRVQPDANPTNLKWDLLQTQSVFGQVLQVPDFNSQLTSIRNRSCPTKKKLPTDRHTQLLLIHLNARYKFTCYLNPFTQRAEQSSILYFTHLFPRRQLTLKTNSQSIFHVKVSIGKNCSLGAYIAFLSKGKYLTQHQIPPPYCHPLLLYQIGDIPISTYDTLATPRILNNHTHLY